MLFPWRRLNSLWKRRSPIKGVRRQPAVPQETEVAFLLAKVPHLGLEKGRLDAHAFRRLLQAWKDPEIDQSRQAFRKKVAEYLERLRTARGGERDLIGRSSRMNSDPILLFSNES